MSYVLGNPLLVGGTKVAVVSRQAVQGRSFGGWAVNLACHKEPAFVVVQGGQGRVVLDMMGAEVALAEVAALCPAVAEF